MRLFFLLSVLVFLSCSNKHEKQESDSISNNQNVEDSLKIELDSLYEFERSEMRSKIDSIQKNGGNLFVHCLVPLCDNENQGIVPVSKSLGDGLNLRTNLYWATGHGMKGYFKKSADWKSVEYRTPADTNILERCVFKRKVGKATVYLVTDAYRGDRMKECLVDYFKGLAGRKTDTLMVDSIVVPLYGNSDMLGVNGHNGLMDNYIDRVQTIRNSSQDAVAIGCVTGEYFRPYFFDARAYPLIMTTGLMYPGAFILDDLVVKWAQNGSELEIRYAAGDAYHRIMNCGQRGGRNLFTTGW